MKQRASSSAKRVRPLQVRILLLLFAAVACLHLVHLRSALDVSVAAAQLPPAVPAPAGSTALPASQPSGVSATWGHTVPATVLPEPKALLSPAPSPVLTVATGANSPFFAAMRNLVGSALFWCPDCPVAVFNLGLTAEELAQAGAWCRTTVHWGEGYKHGDPNTYAFKAAAVAEAVEAYGVVLWLDGGSTVTGWLKPAVLPLLLADGHFLVQGQDMGMVRWVHPAMFAHFGVPAAYFGTNFSFSGNTVGFVRGSPATQRILAPWLACAHNASCIAPPGSSKGNHRYDQAALSVLAYTSGLAITPHTELLAAERGQLQPCEQPSAHVVWTSRSGESCYAKYTHRGCSE